VNRRLAVFIVSALVILPRTSIAQIRPLTNETLAEAMRADTRLPLNGLLIGHDPEGQFANFQVTQRMLDEAPFTILIETPYFRAHYLASEARRRFAPLPALSIEELNAEGVTIRVIPGRNFLAAGTIESVVIKRGDRVVHAIKQSVTPLEIFNNAGATRTLAQGLFQFPLEALTEDAGPYVLVCIGKTGNAYYPAMTDQILSMK
jgi:hypothetical protein